MKDVTHCAGLPSAIEKSLCPIAGTYGKQIKTNPHKATATKTQLLKCQQQTHETHAATKCSSVTRKQNINLQCPDGLVPTSNVTNEIIFGNFCDDTEFCFNNLCETSSSAGTWCGTSAACGSNNLDKVSMIENEFDFLVCDFLDSGLDPNFEFEQSANTDCKQICGAIETKCLHEPVQVACVNLAKQNNCKTCECAYVTRTLTDCKQGGKCEFIVKEHKWHCKGTKRTYINYTCTKCGGEYTMCPNKGCQKVLQWDEKVNIVCVACQLQNRQNRKTGVGAELKWRWHRCLAPDCKAMYVFNRGKRLRRPATRCGRITGKLGCKKARRQYNAKTTIL